IHIDSLIAAAQKLDGQQRKEVGDILTKHYRAMIFKENAEVLSPDYDGWTKNYINPVNKIVAIDELCGKPNVWKLLDNGPKGKQQWLFTSFEPAEKRQPKDKNRFRPVTFPDPLKDWFSVDYDTSDWQSVSFDVGAQAPRSYRNKPAWKHNPSKQTGEVLLMRKTFELKDVDYDLLRLVVYSRQGFEIYINGQKVVSQKGRSKTWNPRFAYTDKNNKLRASLRPGTNVLTAMSFLQYFRGKEGDIEVYVEGLRKLPKPNQN
ncbi:MAG: hypothetical protein KJO79_10600, partial [Verrucomicrobiae bacterium]|nr:hypothetical protein [Verrucomicrobiae bacterium]NNJ87622.1 hypothetical protein [Akkermansiaceae bacterium]